MSHNNFKIPSWIRKNTIQITFMISSPLFTVNFHSVQGHRHTVMVPLVWIRKSNQFVPDYQNTLYFTNSMQPLSMEIYEQLGKFFYSMAITGQEKLFTPILNTPEVTIFNWKNDQKAYDAWRRQQRANETVKERKQRMSERHMEIEFRPGGKGMKKSERKFYKTQLDLLCANLQSNNNLNELRNIAKQLHMSGYSRLNKAQLCRRIAYELQPEFI